MNCLRAGEWGEAAPTGIRVRTTRDLRRRDVVSGECYDYPAGTEGVVLSWSNAGFQGMLAKLETDDGPHIYNVNADDLVRL